MRRPGSYPASHWQVIFRIIAIFVPSSGTGNPASGTAEREGSVLLMDGQAWHRYKAPRHRTRNGTPRPGAALLPGGEQARPR